MSPSDEQMIAECHKIMNQIITDAVQNTPAKSLIPEIQNEWIKYFENVFSNEHKPENVLDASSMLRSGIRSFACGYILGYQSATHWKN